MEKNRKKAGFRLGLISVLVIGMMFTFMTVPRPVIEHNEGEWHIIWEGNLASATEGDPGSGASGFLSVYFHPHTATPEDAYDQNTSATIETNCTNAGLGYANADDTEVDLAHSTEFDVVFRVRGNATNCQVGGVWFDTNLKIQWTSADLSVGADTELTVGASEGIATSNNSDYTFLYMNFWDDNSGSGFTISQDETAEITSIKLLAYY